MVHPDAVPQKRRFSRTGSSSCLSAESQTERELLTTNVKRSAQHSNCECSVIDERISITVHHNQNHDGTKFLLVYNKLSVLASFSIVADWTEIVVEACEYFNTACQTSLIEPPRTAEVYLTSRDYNDLEHRSDAEEQLDIFLGSSVNLRNNECSRLQKNWTRYFKLASVNHSLHHNLPHPQHKPTEMSLNKN